MRTFNWAHVVAVACAGLPLGGCDDLDAPQEMAPEASGPTPTMEQKDASGTPLPVPTYSALRAEIQAAIMRSPCPDEPCPKVSLQPAVDPPSDRSRGQRILLLDQGLLTQAATRYRSRVLAFVRRREGRYETFTPELTVPRDAAEILARIDSEPGEVPAAALDLIDSFKKFLPILPGYSGHGMDMLPFLAEKVPDAQFIIGEDSLSPNFDCALLKGTEGNAAAWSRFEAEVRAARESLGELITRFGVNAVHLSWGFGHELLGEHFQFRCGRAPTRAVTTRIMRAYVELFGSFSRLSSPGRDGTLQSVLLSQAAYPVAPGAQEDNLLDCTPIANRIRVAALTGIPRAEIPCRGSHDYTLMSNGARENSTCTDLIVALGYDTQFDPVREGAYWSYQPFGFSGAAGQPWPASNSFANPVALAHYLYPAQRMPGSPPDAILRALTQDHPLPIIDPLLYRAFPASGVEDRCAQAR